MGGVAVLHPQDLLRDRLNYNRMPLISPSNSTNHSLKSRALNPSSVSDSSPNPSPKTVSNSDRRKRSPQKKTNDLPRFPSKKSSNFGQNGLPRSPLKGGASFNSGKISSGPNLVMGKVTILKRGQALNNDENAEKKTVLSVKENKDEKMVNLSKDEDTKPSNNSGSTQMLLMRMGPEPDMLPKFYAGTAFVASPPPSSVPRPNFLSPENDDSSNFCRLLKRSGFQIEKAG